MAGFYLFRFRAADAASEEIKLEQKMSKKVTLKA